MTLYTTLSALVPGQKGKFIFSSNDPLTNQRLSDLGLIEQTTIECIYTSPFKDPTAFFIRGTTIALRKKDCQKIIIEVLP